MSGFGASAPGKTCFKEFGITAENVAAQAKELVKKLQEES
jgi:transketolase